MKRFANLIFAPAFFLSVSLGLAETGQLSGFIYDQTTNVPIPDANIVIGDRYGTTSQDGGFYFLNNLPCGRYEVQVKVIGYKSVFIQVDVTDDTELNVKLRPMVIEFDPIIVTATMYDHRQSQVTMSSEVLTYRQMKTNAGATAGDMIENIAGVYIKNYDGFAGVKAPSIRGANTDQVVVLLDGMRLNTAQGGGVNLNAFPVTSLDRIEIVRGGHSALLGTDAMGGAIHLITKESTSLNNLSYGFNTEIGSFGTRNVNIFSSYHVGRISSFVSYNHLSSDGDFGYRTPYSNTEFERENNDYMGENLLFKTSWEINPKNKLNFIYNDFLSQYGVAGSVNISPLTNAPMLSKHARAKANRELMSLHSENQLSRYLRLSSKVYYQTSDYHFRDPDIFSDDTHKNSANGIDLQGQFKLNQNLYWISGASVRQDRLQSSKFNADDRHTISMYSQLEINHTLSVFGLETHYKWIPAIRSDKFSDVHTHTSPKLGLLVSAGGQSSLAMRANLGSSYRVPTFDDLYWPEENYGEGWGGSKGNLNLKPETSQNFDMGLMYRDGITRIFQAEISYFENHVKNLINWQQGSDLWWQPQNIGNATISGIETGLKFKLPQNIAFLNVFHTWMKAFDNTSNSASYGKRLSYRPDSKLDIISGCNYQNIFINWNYRQVAKRYINDDNSKSLPEYWIMNGTIGYNFSIFRVNVNAKMQVMNIFNKSIYLNDGYPLPGREFRLSIGLDY